MIHTMVHMQGQAGLRGRSGLTGNYGPGGDLGPGGSKGETGLSGFGVSTPLMESNFLQYSLILYYAQCACTHFT